jgi:hypothetical protein
MTRGIVVCIPKNPNPASPEEYRLLTLLNSDVRIFARIVANRIQPLLREILHPSQFGGGEDNTILDALTTLRDTVALAELRHEPTCMVSLDFCNAFNNIAHEYLYGVLERTGLGPIVANAVRKLYTGATSCIHLNGFLTSPVTVGSSIQQGCPLSAILFNLCLAPITWRVNAALQTTRSRRDNHLPVTVAYVDDVTVILRYPQEVDMLHRAIRTYTLASGAQLNFAKSKALALGGWPEDIVLRGVEYNPTIRVLGITFTPLSVPAPLPAGIRWQRRYVLGLWRCVGGTYCYTNEYNMLTCTCSPRPGIWPRSFPHPLT